MDKALPRSAGAPGADRTIALLRGMEWASIALVMAMVAAAQWLDVKDVIFPEIAALAFGAWVMRERPWPGPAWTIWFSPTLGALTGVGVLEFAPYPLAVLVAIAFVLVLLELRLCRSAMSPAVSAAILPLITDLRGWIYPACVCVLTAAIAVWAHLGDRQAGPGAVAAVEAPTPWTRALVHAGKLVSVVLVMAVLAVWWDAVFIIAPPVIVLFVELANPGSALQGRSFTAVLLLVTGAALGGTIWMLLLVGLAGGPLWLAAGLAMVTALILARWCGFGPPPAFALALLPTILPRAVLPWYPLQVGVGCLVFLVVVRLWFPGEDTPEGAGEAV